MSELINNIEKRKQLLKHLILQLHKGEEAEIVRKQLLELLGQVPYGEVVEVEQELIAEGLPQEDVIQLCDVHSQALKGVIAEDESQDVPPGHPVFTFVQENRALQLAIAKVEDLIGRHAALEPRVFLNDLTVEFNAISDVDKHYRRKENLLFPYLEKLGVTGPPTVMWGKHDQIREQLKAVLETTVASGEITADEIGPIIEFLVRPTIEAVEEMVYKEEKILFPMCMERLTDADWFEIYNQSVEIGFCLYDPTDEWKPQGLKPREEPPVQAGKVQMPSGSFSVEELTHVLNTLPIDITFVDKDDRVKYFSQGAFRIFDRNRSILNRSVQMCHPPSSVHIVDQIISDFKSGKQDRAPFWINIKGKFIHIEYFAVRNENGDYLGTVEMSQDLTTLRGLEGEQRLLSYVKDEE